MALKNLPLQSPYPIEQKGPRQLTFCAKCRRLFNPKKKKSIKDLYQQERFDPTKTQPRPILAKFIRIYRIVFTTILSNRNKVKEPVVIKANINKDERKVESILLQVSWKLIQQSTSHKHNTYRDLSIPKSSIKGLYSIDSWQRLLIATQHYPLLLKQKWNIYAEA